MTDDFEVLHFNSAISNQPTFRKDTSFVATCRALLPLRLTEEKDREHRMRTDGSDEASSSWVTLKERGKAAFERGDYDAAIGQYGLALHPDQNVPAAERQILLSNLVAARLKKGGRLQAQTAVENAKQVRIRFADDPIQYFCILLILYFVVHCPK